MNFINVQDQDGHWYYLPETLKEAFYKAEEEGAADYYCDFINEYGEYRTDGPKETK